MSQNFFSILTILSPNNYSLLRGQLIDAAIFSANFVEVGLLIFNKAVNKPTLCPMYARLCYDLSENLPRYPPEDEVAKEMTFRRVLLNICQESYERLCHQRAVLEQEINQTALKLRILGNTRFIGELFNLRMISVRILLDILHQELLGPKNNSWAKELQIEVVCQLFNTVGKKLDEINSPVFRDAYDVFFQRFKELGSDVELAPRLRYIVCYILSLRSNQWVPRWEENAENGYPLRDDSVRATDSRQQLESVETTTEGESMVKMKMKNKTMKDLMIKKDNKVTEMEKRCITLEYEARKNAQGERYCQIALVLSWLFFAIIMYNKK